MCLASSSWRDREKSQPMYPEPLQGHEPGIYQKQFHGALCRGFSKLSYPDFTHEPPLPTTHFCQRSCRSRNHGVVGRPHVPATFTRYSFLSEDRSIRGSSKLRFPYFPGWGRVLSFSHRPPLHVTPTRGRVGPRTIVWSEGLTLNFPNFTGWR
jgi:hypothetical protein